MLVTMVDSLFRAIFMAYAFSIFKMYAIIVPVIYVFFMFFGICLKKGNVRLNPRDLFGVLISFGCSGNEAKNVEYTYRGLSKIVFALIFIPCLLLLGYTTSEKPDVGTCTNKLQIDSNTTKIIRLLKEPCLKICNAIP